MKKIFAIIIAVILIATSFSTSINVKAQTKTFNSTNGHFSVTVDDVQFGTIGNLITVSPTITFNGTQYTYNSKESTASSVSGFGWDRMNYDGTVEQTSVSSNFFFLRTANIPQFRVSSSVGGVYKMYHLITDSTGDSVIIPITYYIFNPITLSAQDLTVNQGDNWNCGSNVVTGTDGLNNAITSTSTGLTCTPLVDTNVPGTYNVTYNFADPNNVYGSQSTTATVTVMENLTASVKGDYVVCPDTMVNYMDVAKDYINVNSVQAYKIEIVNSTQTFTNVDNTTGTAIAVQDGTITYKITNFQNTTTEVTLNVIVSKTCSTSISTSTSTSTEVAPSTTNPTSVLPDTGM